MKTASEAELATHHGHIPGVAEQDPEHDIDGGKATRWLVFWTLLLFLAVWGLYLLFGAVVESERFQKIDERPTVERDALRQWEAETLAGKHGGTSIEAAMQSLAAGK